MTLSEKVEKKLLDEDDGFKQIGLTLKDARLSQGWSVKEISEKLRISVDFLSKLEAGAFHELPAPAYVTGFLRSYGRCVGLAPDPLVARYMAVTEGKGSQPSYKPPMSTRPPQRSAPAVASMLVVFALIAYGGWYWLKTASPPASDIGGSVTKTAALSSTPDQEGTVIGVASLNRTPEGELAVDNSADRVGLSGATSSLEKMIKSSGSVTDANRNEVTDPLSTELPLNERAAFEPAQIESSSVQTAKTGQVKTDLTVGEAQTSSLPKAVLSKQILPDELVKTQMLTTSGSASIDLLNSNRAIANLRNPAKEITIRAVAASWVEIVRDNGEEVLAKLMQAGDSYVVEGNTRLFLSTGNAGGLMVVIGTDNPLSMGDVGEIVRDLPLVTDELRKSL